MLAFTLQEGRSSAVRRGRSKFLPATIPATSEALEPRRLLAATLVRDINTTPYNYPVGELVEPVRIGDVVYFTSHQKDTGLELWKTDGTPAGTRLVKDVLPGPLSSNPRSLTPVGDTLYFMADDGVTGTELWKTDGTRAGTVRVRDLTPGPESSSAYRFGTLGDVLIFHGPGASGRDSQAIWRSDGTATGTVMLKPVFDSVEAPPSRLGLQAERNVALFNGRLYFPAAGSAGDVELWATDGTEAGTVRVADIYPGATPAWPGALTVAGDKLFFMARAPGGGALFNNEPFVTDGTAAGTRLVRDTVPGGGGQNATMTAALNGAFYFVTFGGELWRSDGTPEGTSLATGMFTGNTTGIATAGGWLYFVVNNGTELRRSNGTVTDGILNSTVVGDFHVRPITPGVGVAGLTNVLSAVDNTVYFAAGGEPWKSNGTTAGTVPLAEVRPGPAPSNPHFFTGTDPNQAVFFAYDAAGLALWKAVPAGTAPEALNRIGANLGSNPVPVALDPDSSRVVLFLADNGGVRGHEVWRSDGTEAGTFLVKDFGVVSGSSSMPGIIPAVNGRALLPVGYDIATGRPNELWSTDGTPQGTVRFPAPLYIDDPTVHNGRLYFFSGGTRDDGADAGLWSTDGTPAGTALVRAFPPTTWAVDIASDAQSLYLGLHSNQTGQTSLWKSDGTAGGTAQITTLSSLPGDMTAAGGLVYFTQSGNSPFVNADLWRTDGTAAGTVRVAPLPNLSGLQSHLFTPFNGKLYYRGWDVAHGPEVWATDGTPAGTTRVTNIAPGPDTIDVRDLEVMGGRLYVATSHGLYRSDGTEGGTTLIPTHTGEPLTNVGGQRVTTNGLTRVGDRLYFTATHARLGEEVWRVSDDGVVVPLGDIAPHEGTGPASLAAAGDTLYFQASDRRIGSELWMDRPADPATPATVVGRHVFYNHSAFDGAAAAATTDDDSAIASDKAALLPGGSPSFANVTSYTRGINGIMIDVAGLPQNAALSQDDFDVHGGPPPASVTVRRGAGVNGSDRVTLTWPDGAVRNTWLRVTVKATPDTGLLQPDVFSFGNLVGETGDPASPLRVTPMDLLLVRRHLSSRAPVSGRFDFNRDGRVTVTDYGVARSAQWHVLPPPPAAAAPLPAPTPGVLRDEAADELLP